MAKKLHEYRGQSILVTFDAKRCIHAAECVHGLPGVFDPQARPWIDPDGAAVDEVTDVVVRCPAGALKLERLDGGAGESTPDDNTIAVVADGPFYARGDVEVVDATGSVVVRDTRVALCRCGASDAKPLCDGKHTEAGFRDSGAIPDPRLKAAEGVPPEGGKGNRSGKLKIVLAKDGPLILDGPVTISGGEDRCAGSRGALCRCGESANRPFCDGAHARIGFSG